MKIEGVSQKRSLTELLKQRNKEGENNVKYWISEKVLSLHKEWEKLKWRNKVTNKR